MELQEERERELVPVRRPQPVREDEELQEEFEEPQEICETPRTLTR